MSIWRSIHLVSFRFDVFRFVLFRFVSFRFDLFRFVSICFVSFRSVSFRFDLFRFVPFRFCFVSHFTGTLWIPPFLFSTYTDFLKFPPHISDIQQVLSDQRKKCTTTPSRTEQFFNSENQIDMTYFRNSVIEVWDWWAKSRICPLSTFIT